MGVYLNIKRKLIGETSIQLLYFKNLINKYFCLGRYLI